MRALLDDLLITVTTFFRDPTAWAALADEVIGPLVDETSHGDHIRVWCAGCASGEEAYSLAIAFDEVQRQRDTHRNVIVFASDVDDHALRLAREGLYPEAIAADVSDGRLERYFQRDGSHYRVAREIRDRVVFAEHSILRDPLFSRLHLITCRNVLISFDRELQIQAMTVFRYACREGGYLFLGASEHAADELFKPVDRKFRIFVARPRLETPHLPLPDIISVAGTGAASATLRPAGPHRAPVEQHLASLEALAPPSVLLDERGTILHLSPTAPEYLRQSDGPLARRITDLVRDELRDDAHALLHRAAEGAELQVSPFQTVAFDGVARRVALSCRRRVADGRVELLMMFIDAGAVALPAAGAPEPGADAEPLRQLREPLRQAEQRIESIRDEHDLTNEELRAANEGLQSVNEELQTVNNELKLKLDEVALAHADLENLMAATNVATLFLNRELRIKRYTTQLEQIFNIRQRDYDRSIGDLPHLLDYPQLHDDARAVLETGATVERDVTSRDRRAYVARVGPYRSPANQTAGVVMTFIDVTELKRVEAALRGRQQQLATELETMRRLHRMAINVATASTMQDALLHVLGAAIDLHGADGGMVQLLDGDGLRPSVAAEQGLSAAFLERESADGGHDKTPAWQRALRSRKVVQLVEPQAAAAGDAGRNGDYRAVQSMPLVNRDGRLVGALSIYFREVHVFAERDGQLGTMLGQQAAELIESRRQQLAASVNRLAAVEVRELLRRLVVVQEDERRRIARDLHDQMGQLLTALRLNLEVLASQLPGEGSATVAQAQQLAEEVDRSIDYLTWELRPAALEQLGLPKALGELVATWSARFVVAAECDCSGPDLEVPMDIAVHLYRIVQEALHNVHKHAAATRVTVALETRPRTLLLTVEDNGRGFDPDTTTERGLGLLNIRERAALLDAELEINSGPSHGTTVFLRVPFEPNSRTALQLYSARPQVSG